MVHPPRLELGIIVPKTIVISTSLWVQKVIIFIRELSNPCRSVPKTIVLSTTPREHNFAFHVFLTNGIYITSGETMEYNDERLQSQEDYQKLATAYADALKEKGFQIISISRPSQQDIAAVFEKLYKIKSLLFCMGGFLGTSTFYSLNERQLEKFKLIFEYISPHSSSIKTHDKTKCFLSFISAELSLINQLNTIAEQSPFEIEIKRMITQRLISLSNILTL